MLPLNQNFQKNTSLQILCEAVNSQFAQIRPINNHLNPNEFNALTSADNSMLLTQPILLQFLPISDNLISTSHYTKSASFSDYSVSKIQDNVNPAILEKAKFKSYSVHNSNINKCQYCDRVCTKPSVLEKHIRTHTNERPYPCVECNQSFKTLSNLHKHLKARCHINIQNQNVENKNALLISSIAKVNELYNNNNNLHVISNITENSIYNENNLKSKLKNTILKKTTVHFSNEKSCGYNPPNNTINNNMVNQTFSEKQNSSLSILSQTKSSESITSRLDPKTVTDEMIRDHINELISKNEKLVEANLKQAPQIRTKSIKIDNTNMNIYKKIAPKLVCDKMYFLNKEQISNNLNVNHIEGLGIPSALERQLSLPVTESNNLSKYLRMTKSNTISDPTYVDSGLVIHNKRKSLVKSTIFNKSLDISNSLSNNFNDSIVCKGDNIKLFDGGITLVNEKDNFLIPKFSPIEIRKRGRPKGSKTKNQSQRKSFLKQPYRQYTYINNSNSEGDCKNILKEYIMKRSYSSENSVKHILEEHLNNVKSIDDQGQILMRSKSFDSSMPLKKRLLIKEIALDNKYGSLLNNEDITALNPENLNNNLSILESNSIESKYYNLSNPIIKIDSYANDKDLKSKINTQYLSENNYFKLITNGDKCGKLGIHDNRYLQYLKLCIIKSTSDSHSKFLYKKSRNIIKKYNRIKMIMNKNRLKIENKLNSHKLFDSSLVVYQTKETNNNYIKSFNKNYTQKENHTCSICNKLCTSAMTLMMHRNTHFLGKKYKCRLGCNMSFELLKSMHRHQIKFCHYRNNNYIYSKYTRSENAGDFLKDPRPYKCNVCVRAFRSYGHLAKHCNSKFHAKFVHKTFDFLTEEQNRSKKFTNLNENPYIFKNLKNDSDQFFKHHKKGDEEIAANNIKPTISQLTSSSNITDCKILLHENIKEHCSNINDINSYIDDTSVNIVCKDLPIIVSNNTNFISKLKEDSFKINDKIISSKPRPLLRSSKVEVDEDLSDADYNYRDFPDNITDNLKLNDQYKDIRSTAIDSKYCDNKEIQNVANDKCDPYENINAEETNNNKVEVTIVNNKLNQIVNNDFLDKNISKGNSKILNSILFMGNINSSVNPSDRFFGIYSENPDESASSNGFLDKNVSSPQVNCSINSMNVNGSKLNYCDKLLNTCNICGFTTNELENLLLHIYSHIRLYVCKNCDAAFSTKFLLESHSLLHSNCL